MGGLTRACACVVRSSDSLWSELVHQVLSEGSGRDRAADGQRTDGSGAHVLWLVNGNGLDLLSVGGDDWPPAAAGCQAGAFNPV